MSRERDALARRREELVVPGDKDFTPDERATFSALPAADRKRIRDEAAELDRQIRDHDTRIATTDVELHRLGEQSRAAQRVIQESGAELEQIRPYVQRLAKRLAEIDTRLAQIQARRSEVAGDWSGDYNRIGERPPCFLAGTLVHTPDGVRPIEQLQRGDRVLAWMTDSSALTSRPVLRPERGRTLRVLDVDVAGERVTTTPRHRFWIPDREEWLEARALVPGMQLLDTSGGAHVVEGVQERAVEEDTFNLSVDGEHDYFVGSVGVLVHNGQDEPEEEEQQQIRISRFLLQIKQPPNPFLVRYYVIVHESDPTTIIYVGSTEKPLTTRLTGHVEERRYRQGAKAGAAWLDEAGLDARARRGANPTEAQLGPFIIREIDTRVCHSHFERFVWELYYIESIRASAGATMQNDFGTPPVGDAKFREFRDYYLARLCAK